MIDVAAIRTYSSHAYTHSMLEYLRVEKVFSLCLQRKFEIFSENVTTRKAESVYQPGTLKRELSDSEKVDILAELEEDESKTALHPMTRKRLDLARQINVQIDAPTPAIVFDTSHYESFCMDYYTGEMKKLR